MDKQVALIANLSQVLKIVKGQKFTRSKKIENLRLLMTKSENYDFQKLDGISLPLDPSIKISGIRTGNYLYINFTSKHVFLARHRELV